jgi:predicted nuclease of restriction endonuclease-like (RecB) superfamily
MNIDNRDERRFYEIESGQNQWSLSELKRQFNAGIYERLALTGLVLARIADLVTAQKVIGVLTAAGG